MRAILGGTLAALVVCFGVSADDKKDTIDAKKLVGKWEPKEKPEDGEPTLLEFTKDGRVFLTHSIKGEEFKNEAKYALDGNKLTLTLELTGKEVKLTATLTKLTDAELTAKTQDGKEKTLVRIKDKK